MARIDVTRSSHFVGSARGLWVLDAAEPDATRKNAIFLPGAKGKALFSDPLDFGATLYVRLNQKDYALVSGEDLGGTWQYVTVDPKYLPVDFQAQYVPTQCRGTPVTVKQIDLTTGGSTTVTLARPCFPIIRSDLPPNGWTAGILANGRSTSWVRASGPVRLVAVLGSADSGSTALGFGTISAGEPLWAFEIANFDAKADHIYRVEFSWSEKPGTVQEIPVPPH
jgi:hypothetical protein